jgi:hypothetical protein
MSLLLLAVLSHPATAATCSLRDLSVDPTLLNRYAADSAGLTVPKLFRTEDSPEFGADYPTTYWALQTSGTTIQVKVHHAMSGPSTSGEIDVIWFDTLLTIDPTAKSVSGADECSILHPVTEHVLEILNVIRAP